MVIVDTSIIIDHLRQQGTETETPLIKLANRLKISEIGISTISIQELYAGKSTIDPVKLNYLKLTIVPLVTIPYTYQIAEIAGKIIRDNKGITFADAAIASTCLINNSDLLTLNTKDFINIKDIRIFKL